MVRDFDAQPIQPGRGQDDGVVLAVVKSTKPRLDVAADRHGDEVRARPCQLRRSPRRAGADASAERKILEAPSVGGHDAVSSVGPLEHRGNHEPIDVGGRQVLEGMDDDVHAAVEERLLELAGELPVTLDPATVRVLGGDGVTAGGDGDDLGLAELGGQ